MIEEVLPAVYKIEVPLPDSPLKSINSYVLKSRERNLIVDTGMNRDECRQVLEEALQKLSIDLENTDFFITHLHVDHLELAYQLASEKSAIFFNNPDAEALTIKNFEDKAAQFVSRHGFPKRELQEALEKHPRSSFIFDESKEFTILYEGDILEVGDYRLKCLETPGHTYGSMCLYEPHKKILFSGDHILEDITPNISSTIDHNFNPLESYLQSLEKISDLDVKLVLPGHRGIFFNCRQRISEIKYHHRQREEEILSLLRKKPCSAYWIASEMSWELNTSWEQCPVTQKWFAVAETLAHLKYMEGKGRVCGIMQGEDIVYRCPL